ncbi:Dabb family protein [Fervidobacterium sp.]
MMWKIKEGFNKDEIYEQIKEKVLALKDFIPQIRHIEVGRNITTSINAYDVVLYSEFDSKEDLDFYLVHPEHVKVADYIKTVVADRKVVDYVI